MWSSEIRERPEPRSAATYLLPSRKYKAWLERIAKEPWVTALTDLVEQSGWWVGTEEQLFEEMKRQVSREVSSSPDFPSNLDELDEYMVEARDLFYWLEIGVEDWWNILAEQVEWEFDAPGWGEEKPILVCQGEAVLRTYYRRALELRDPLPMILFWLVAKEKTGEYKRWEGDTSDLLWSLHLEGFSVLSDAEQDQHLFDFDRPEGDYATLRERMAECAPLFDELGIQVQSEEHADGSINWVVEVPGWKNTDTR